MASTCPFCGSDPYEYVNNGVGMEKVAVTCCELGIEYFDPKIFERETVEISVGEFQRMADVFFAMRTLGMNFELLR